jgi:hypothetical protein
MAVLESVLYRYVKKAWPDVLQERIENSACPGMADLNCLTQDGHEFWLEMKSMDRLGMFTLRPSQSAWHAKRKHAGGRSYILAIGEERIELYSLDDNFRWHTRTGIGKPFIPNLPKVLHEIRCDFTSGE